MRAIIMAGGEGSRLRPLTETMPKPMAKLCGKPVVHFILDLLAQHGCTEAVFTLRYKAEQIEQLFEECEYKGIKLSFSREDEPLGTAGCVRKAAKGFTDDFVVISGDALCDFDLGAALAFHKKSKAEATIITKQVNDPREYGLVISQDGRINGFSEKPSFLGCVSDHANTGVYILNPSVLELIPDGKMWDFARDVFPRMLKEELMLMAYPEQGYWCDIGDLTTYSTSQLDILNGLVRCTIAGRKLADGVYSQSKIPDSTVIIPPCYIGSNVEIGENCVIEATVIGNNTSIGQNSRVYNSIILDGSFLGSDVKLNGTIICENAKLKQGAIAQEGSVVGQNSVVGENSSLAVDVKVYQGKVIESGQDVHKDVIQGTKTRTELHENGITGTTNIEITPEFAARLGCALSTVCGGALMIAADKCASAVCLKNAVLSGFVSTGRNAYDLGCATVPIMIETGKFVENDIIVHVSGGMRTTFTIRDKHGLTLTRLQERALEGAINRSEYRSASWGSFGKTRRIKYAGEIYAEHLKKHAGFKSRYPVFLNCNNKELAKLIAPVFGEIGEAPDGMGRERLVVTLNRDGSRAEFRISGEKDELITHDKLILLAAVNLLSQGKDIALPADFAAAADALAGSFGRRVHRFFSCSNDKSDTLARELAAQQQFLFDGAVLALNVLGWVSKNGITLTEACQALPAFNRESRVVSIKCPPQRILSRLCDNNTGIGEGIYFGQGSHHVLLRSNKKGNALFVYAESARQETAQALCDDVEKLVKQLADEEDKG